VTPSGEFALICHRGETGKTGYTVEFIYWPSLEEAEQARDELAPCSAKCCGIHTVVP
jgi:hypothetical protein